MIAILSVLIGAVTTGIIGNFLVQRWQHRTWRAQQVQLGHQAELADLRKLLEEISVKSADRHNAMRRLVGSLAPDTVRNSTAMLDAYREQVAIWNASLNSIYVRLRLAVDYGYTLRFESDVHRRFYLAGQAIEQVLRRRKAGASPNWSDLVEAQDLLSGVQGAIYLFLRDLTDIVERRREEIYFGRQLPYRVVNLPEYSLLELCKAIFVSRVDCFYVVRAA